MSQSSAGMNLGGIQPLTIGDIYGTHNMQKKFPNKKISISVHGANNGYVVEVEKSGYGNENELYIISEDQDLGVELGKIITHNALSNNHE